MNRSLPTLAMLAGLATTTSCINESTTFYEVTVSGSVDVDPAFTRQGKLNLGLYYANAGSGQLAFTVDPIESRELGAIGPVEEVFLIPIDEREGLLVYAWLDIDGDGVLCAVDGATEPTAIVEVDDFSDLKVNFSLTLDQACAGAEALYP